MKHFRHLCSRHITCASLTLSLLTSLSSRECDRDHMHASACVCFTATFSFLLFFRTCAQSHTHTHRQTHTHTDIHMSMHVYVHVCVCMRACPIPRNTRPSHCIVIDVGVCYDWRDLPLTRSYCSASRFSFAFSGSSCSPRKRTARTPDPLPRRSSFFSRSMQH